MGWLTDMARAKGFPRQEDYSVAAGVKRMVLHRVETFKCVPSGVMCGRLGAPLGLPAPAFWEEWARRSARITGESAGPMRNTTGRRRTRPVG